MIHVKLKIRITFIIVRNIQSNRKIQIQSLYKMHKHIVIYLITQFIDVLKFHLQVFQITNWSYK